MKALVASRYGGADVLRIESVPIPQPSDDELLIRVMASTVNRTDTGILSGTPVFARLVFGIQRPRRRIPGTEFSGIVEAVGAERSDFKVGDRVFGFHDEGTSAHAEFLIVSNREAITSIPDGMEFENAAACSEGPFYSLNLLRNLSINPGDRVLINGISGGIGSAMLQFMKQKQAHVVGVCSAKTAPLLLRRGADEIHDFETTDFRQVEETPFDFILDTVGNYSYLACRGYLSDEGTYASTELGPWYQNVIYAIAKKSLGTGHAIFPIPRDVQGCQKQTLELISKQEYQPLIDRSYSFGNIVEAYRYVSTGMKTGNVVVTFNAG